MRKPTGKKKGQHTYDYGVKYLTPLLSLPFNNLIEDTPHDYMHCILEGVLKTFLHVWKQFYFKPKEPPELEERLALVRVIAEISRLMRSFKEVKLNELFIAPTKSNIFSWPK